MEELIIYNENEFNFNDFNTNIEVIKKQIQGYLDKIKDFKVSEENIALSKTMRADINKIKKQIEDKRKEIKNKFMLPYNNFEIKVKEIVNIIEETNNKIDLQIKELENQEKAKKKEMLIKMFEINNTDNDFIIFEDVFEENMLNKTVKLETAIETIKEKIKTILNNLELIQLKYKDNEFYDILVAEFKTTKNIMAVENKLNILEQQKARQQKIEEEKKKDEIIQKMPQVEVKQETKEEKQYHFRLEFVLTLQQRDKLKQFLNDNNFTYFPL